MKLLNARNAKGLTQQEVAERTALSIITVHNAEQGDNVFPKTACKLATFYGIELSELMIPIRDEFETIGSDKEA